MCGSWTLTQTWGKLMCECVAMYVCALNQRVLLLLEWLSFGLYGVLKAMYTFRIELWNTAVKWCWVDVAAHTDVQIQVTIQISVTVASSHWFSASSKCFFSELHLLERLIMWHKMQWRKWQTWRERECHQLPPAVPGIHCNDNYLDTETSVTAWKRDSDTLNTCLKKKKQSRVFFLSARLLKCNIDKYRVLCERKLVLYILR